MSVAEKSAERFAAAAVRLREAAEARPLKLPVRRLVDDSHRHLTEDGLTVTFTIEVSPHSRIEDAVFERADRPPSDEECQAWLAELIPSREPQEAPGLPGAFTRRFEAFDRSPQGQAPQA